MSKLNKDILILLFEELQDDSNSLFSCLLANRLWCETIIPILWRNPWRYIYNCKINSLYYVITFYLSDDIKEFLARQGIRLPSISQPLLFDYLSFCRSMNIRSMDTYVFTYINHAETSEFNQFLLRKEVYSLFIRKCPELKYMDMRSIEYQIFYFPESKICFNSLCELKCDSSINSIYFYELACICNSIERLIIVNNSLRDNHGIIKLIEVQRNLKYFEWEDDLDDDLYDDDDDDDDDDNYKVIEKTFLELAKKAHTLTHFIISFDDTFEHTFLPNILSELHNLLALKLDFPFSYNYEINSAYPNLEILQLGNVVCIDIVTCIIKNSGGHLRKILINIYDINIKDDDLIVKSFNLICAIYENCPLVEYLSLALPLLKEHYIEFEKLLKACQKLRVLLLNIKELLDADEKTNYLVLKVLNQSPINLREIRFLNYFKFPLESLEEFLENWRGRPALSILYTGKRNKVYTEIINKYKNDNVLKDFRRINKKDRLSISYPMRH